ncbi:oligosaccharide repeat unit polymerase [Photobacterium lutimaris]|uniref:oligosaccharide repeat unit polymerase n=1 Tax=Photobacterium lutimaris TaxID=388278 RepID=UPI00105BD6B7|nr:oligosaccharide repeat unit polymerase [Photobacterium lutimaris]
MLKLEKITRLYKMIGGGVVLTLYFLSFIMFIIGAGGINEFLFPVSRFNFSNEKIVNLAYIISLLTYFYSLLRHYNYRKNHVLVIFGMLYVLIYPMSLSGRAVVLPFVMMIIAAYFSDNGLGKLKLLFLFSLISAFYINALYVRNNGVGIDNFIIGFVTTYEDIPFLFDFFFATVSGFATTTVTHSGLFDGTIDVIPNPILFLIYISPIPSLFLPTELFVPYQSLTPHFGFSIGINSDIVSESMLWFGMNGVIFIGFILGWVTRYVDWRTLSKDMIAKLIFFSYTYLILMSNIASMRASSRFIILFLTFILLRWILIKFTRITKGS